MASSNDRIWASVRKAAEEQGTIDVFEKMLGTSFGKTTQTSENSSGTGATKKTTSSGSATKTNTGNAGADAISQAMSQRAETLAARVQELNRLQEDLNARYAALQNGQSTETAEQLALEQDRLNDRKVNYERDSAQYGMDAAYYDQILAAAPYIAVERQAEETGTSVSGGVQAMIDTMQQRVNQIDQRRKSVQEEQAAIEERVRLLQHNTALSEEERAAEQTAINQAVARLTGRQQNLMRDAGIYSEDARAYDDALIERAEQDMMDFAQRQMDAYYDETAMQEAYEGQRAALYAEWQELQSREQISGIYGDRTASDVWSEIQGLEDSYKRQKVEADEYWTAKQLQGLSEQDRENLETIVRSEFGETAFSRLQPGKGKNQEVSKAYQDLYEKYSYQEVESYLQIVRRQENAKTGTIMQETVQKLTKEKPVAANVAIALSKIPATIGAAAEFAGQIVNNPAGYRTLDVFGAGNVLQNAGRTVQQTTVDEIKAKLSPFWGNVASGAYQLGMSTVDSLVAMGTGTGLTLAVNAATNTMQDITERGGTIGQALVGGILAGAAEAVFEKVSIENFQALSQKEVVRTVRDWVGNVAKSMATNASEEMATEFANIVTDSFVMGEFSNYAEAVREMMEQNPGMSEGEAKMRVAGQMGLQILESGASGAIMGGFFGLLGSGIGQRRTTLRDSMVSGAIAQGLGYEESEAFQLAAGLQVQLNEGLDVSDEDLSRLIAANQVQAEQREAAGANAEQTAVAAKTEDVLALPEAMGQIAEAMPEVQTETVVETSGEDENVRTTESVQEAETELAQETQMQEEVRQEVAAPTVQEDVQEESTAGNIPARVEQESTAEGVTEENTLRQDAVEDLRRLSEEYQGVELQQAAQNLANDMRMAGDTAYAEEIEAVAAEMTTAETAYNEDNEYLGGTEYGREESGNGVRYGGERDDGAYSGGQTGTVAEGAGRDPGGDVSDVAGGRTTGAEGRESNARRDQNAVGTRKGSTKELFGFENGSVTDSVGIYDELTPEMEDARQQAEKNGYNVRFADNTMSFNANGGEVKVDAVYQDGDIVVNRNSNRWDFTQLLNHEMFHGFAEDNEGLVDAMVLQVFGDLSDSEIDEIISKYRTAYRGAQYTDQKILEEICADAYAGMDRENIGLADRTESARAFVERATDMREIRKGGSRETRAGPEGTKNAPADAKTEKFSVVEPFTESFSVVEPTSAELLERERELDDRIASLEIEAAADETARVQLVDARLERAAVQAQRREMEPTRESGKEKLFRPTETVRKTENRILDLFRVQAGSRAELRGQLGTILDRILKDGYVGESDVNAVLRTMYNSGVEVMPADPAYEGIAETLRGRHIYVSPEVRAEFGDDWKEMREALFGRRIYTSQKESDMGIDSVYSELAEEYPGLFDAENTDMRGMLEELLEAAALGRAVHVSLHKAAEARGLDSEEEFARMVDIVSQELAKFADLSGLESRMRQRTADELAKQREHYAELRRKASERRAVAEEMNKIRNSLKRLQKRAKVNDTTLTRVLANQDEAVRSIAERAIAQMSTVANRITGRKLVNLLELKNAYDEAAKSENFVPNPATEKALERVGQIHLNDLTVEDLHALRDAIERVDHDLKMANEMIGDAWDAQVSEAGEHLVQEIDFAKGGRGGTLVGALYNEESLSPSRALLRYVGYDRSGTMGRLVKDFEDGDLRAMEYSLGTDEIFFSFQRNEKNQKWLQTASGQNAKTVKVEIPRILGWGEGDQPIYAEDGSPNTMEIELTQMMLVQMAMDLQSEDNLRHVKYGGYTLPVIRYLKSGHTAQAYAKTGAEMKGVKLGPETMRSIVEKHLAPEGKEYAKLQHRYYNGFSKDRINRTSRMLDGVDKALEKNYYPIRSDDSYLATEFNVFDGTLEGMGSLKSREYFAKNPIILGEAHTTLQWHRDNMARYYGYAVPKRNFQAIMNHHGGKSNETIEAVLQEKWGKNAGDFIKNFIRMVETERIEDGQDFLSKLTGNYVRGVLNYNVWSALKQVAAIPTAATSLGPGAMAAGLMPSRVRMDLVRKYTPYLEYRNKGYTYQELAEYIERGGGAGDKVWQTLTGQNWLNAMDTFVNKRMWAAAEAWVKMNTKLRPSENQELIDAGQDPYYKKVAEVFNRATHDTQTNYNMMSRPFLLHRKLLRPFTMFRTDAYQSIGILRESIGAWETARRHLKAKDGMADRKSVNAAGRHAVNAMAGVMTAAIMGAAIDVIRNAARGNDDDIWKEMDETKLDPTKTGSTKDLFGFPSGLTTDRVGLLENVTPEMKAIQKQLGEYGYTVYFTNGNLHLSGDENGSGAFGVYWNDILAVNVMDALSGDWIATINHEFLHALESDGNVDVFELIAYATADLSDEEYETLLDEVMDAYRGVGYTDEEIMEEFACNLFAGIEDYAGILSKEWTARAREYVELKTGIKAIEHNEKKELDFVKLAGELLKDGAMNLAGGVLLAEEIAGWVDYKLGGDYFFQPEISSVSAIIDLGDTIWKSFESIGKVATEAVVLKKADGDWVGYLNREADTIHGAVREVALDLSNVLGVPIKNAERTIANGLGNLIPGAKVVYQGWYSDLSAGALEGLEGKALDAGMKEYLKDELGVVDEAVRDELVRLYEIYGEEVLPHNEPPENIMGETEDQDRVASVEDQANWEESYRSTVIDGLSGLIESSDFQVLSDEEKKLVIKNMTNYASGNADDMIGHADVGQWIKNITTAYQNGAEMEDAVIYRAISETIRADKNENGNAISGTVLRKKVEMLDEMDMNDPKKAAILMAFEENEGALLKEAMDSGLSWDEYAQMMKNDTGSAEQYVKLTSEGLGHEDAMKLVGTETVDQYLSLTAEGLSHDVALEVVKTMTDLKPEKGASEVSKEQIISALVSTDLSEEGKYDAIGSVLEEGSAAYDTMRVVQDTGLSVEQYVTLRTKDSDVNKYLEAVEQGFRSDSAYKVVTAVRNMPELPDGKEYETWQVQSAAVDACDNVEDQVEAYVLYSESGEENIDRAKITEAVTYDITPKMFLDAKQLFYEKYDADNSGKFSMEEVKNTLESMDLTNRQKAAVFQMFSMGWKKNPYGDASSIREAYKAAQK